MSHSKSRKHEIRVYIAISVAALGICILVLASAFYVIVCMKRKKNTKEGYSSCNKSVNLELQQLNLSVRTASEKKVSFESQIESLDGHVLLTTPAANKPAAGVVESYTVDEINIATADFSSTNLIEGSVYHGRLKGKNVAVKFTDHGTISKIRFDLLQGMTRFHPNIIRLLGVCSGTDNHGSITTTSDLFLVFEYAKNGSLKDWIHGGLAMKSHFIASCSCFLTWNQRLKICLDVATALQYMHQIINPSYVHNNIKSRNIFLDEEFHAKVGNFGMDACVKDVIHPEKVPFSGNLNSNYPIMWDKGYIAPELEHSSPDATSTPSMDIYAYGIVLLEILSGKPPIRWVKSDNNDVESRLSDEIKAILESCNIEDKLKEWMDTALGESYSFDVVMVLANLARACVDDDPLKRPNAADVVVKLSELVAEREEQVVVRESSCRPLVAQPFPIKDVNDF
ncbi:protein LYK2-like [Bidens hawaiensis]|uniref:protein LYK2-like n=1 Tax=Bidens hawaiensis TaxID=980011 RepID=UPI00404A006D